MATNRPNSSIAAASAPTGMTSASTEGPRLPARASAMRPRLDLADHTLDQIVHLFEHRIGLLQGLTGRDDLLAGVVLERALEDDVFALHHRRVDAVGLLPGRVRHRLAVRRHFHEALLQAAAHEILEWGPGHRILDVLRVGREPIPFGAGQVALGRQRRLVGVIAAGEDAALLGGLDDDLGTVDVAGDHVDALVDHAIGGFGLLYGQRPVAGDNELAGDLRVDAARAHEEGIAVAQYLRDRLCGGEARLLALAGVAGDHAVQVLAFVDVAAVAAGVHRVPALGPQAAP